MLTVDLEKKASELKKHVAMIHSNNRLTLVQRKIANALLYNAYSNLLEKNEHEIHVKTLCELIGYDSKDYKKIKESLITLISTVIEWNLIDKDNLDKEEIWNASAIIADASIDGPMCTYSYSNKMRQLLYMPEMYGRVDLNVQSRFTSSYGLALYENCIRYQNISHTPWFAMLTFRKLMGVEEGRYEIFRDFKRRVLNKAISEVNEHAPIFVSVKFRKVGRQIVALQFLIKKAEKSLLENKPSEPIDKSLANRLQQEYGFIKSKIEQIFSRYDEKYILEKISLIESSAPFQSGKIANLARYLEKALEQDFQPPKSSKDRAEMLRFQRKNNEELHRKKADKLTPYHRYQNEILLEQYKSLTNEQQNQIDKEFCGYLTKISRHFYKDLFLRDGFKNHMVVDQFNEFARIQRKDLLAAAMNFDDFCELENWDNF